ncbi:MAG: Gfo/Idh/MocA family oxidoreductase [Candidatus Cloacimonas sp.]|jgi:NDP-hexose-3-ketoreductase|nr:Gfo/Idh/MocA family oxidoreductase [Candidatus Cloacimonas sp.]
MEKLKFGVIGCGYQTQKNMAPAMAKCENTEIQGFVDLEASKADNMASEYGVQAYPKLDAMLSDKSIEAVYIATPISTHEELCTKAAQAGKHILCEKSLALNPLQDKKIRDYCAKSGVYLMEGLMYQFHSQHQFVRDMITKGEIGEPRVFYAWFGFPPFPSGDFRMQKQLGGGALLDAGAYVIHAAKNFFGSEPISEHRVLHHDKNGLDMHGSILMDFGDNQTAQLSFGMNNSYKNSYSIWGTKGEITVLRAFSIPEHYIPICRIVNQGLVREYQLPPCNHFVEELKFFVSSTQG